MSLVAVLNIVGLVAGLAGALIVAKFGLPSIDVLNEGAYVGHEVTPKMRRYGRLSRYGLWLIGVGFVFQLVAVVVGLGLDPRQVAELSISFPRAKWGVLAGLIVTMLLGAGVGCLVKEVGEAIPLPPPASSDPKILAAWERLVGQSTGGAWIGRLERLIFFAGCWFQGWLLITGWLVFKLAFYWQGANFTAFPRTPPNADQLDWMATKRQVGTHHVATALVGTGANIVIALIGVAVGKWSQVQ
jgi:hypothetical protein